MYADSTLRRAVLAAGVATTALLPLAGVAHGATTTTTKPAQVRPAATNDHSLRFAAPGKRALID
jgi:hypothetical protein